MPTDQITKAQQIERDLQILEQVRKMDADEREAEKKEAEKKDAEAGETLDKILACLDTMTGKLDSLSSRMDAYEKRADGAEAAALDKRKDGEVEEAGEGAGRP